MIDRLETCRVYRATIPLSFLQISDLYTLPTRFYESLKDKIGCVTCFPNLVTYYSYTHTHQMINNSCDIHTTGGQLLYGVDITSTSCIIKTHDSESRGQEEAAVRDE